MLYKYYQFHYAEKIGVETVGLGILNYKTTDSTKENFIKYARVYLNKPDAVIAITHISKLKRSEYETIIEKKIK